MTPQDIKEAVETAQKTIKLADYAFSNAKAQAERIRQETQAPAKAELKRLKERFADRAHELAIAANACPVEHWGSPMDPHEVDVQAEGLELSWDINGDYAPATFLATWQDLLAPVQQNLYSEN